METPIYVSFDMDVNLTEEETKRYLGHFLDELYNLGLLTLKPAVTSVVKGFKFHGKESVRASIMFE